MSKMAKARKSIENEEIINVLRNSPKGQLKYEIGWDRQPQAVWHLVSMVQREEDLPKMAVLERACLNSSFQNAEETDYRNGNLLSDLSPIGTSSGSGSRNSFYEEDKTFGDNNEDCLPVFPPSSKPPRKLGYGIFEDECDEKDLQRESDMMQATSSINHVKLLLHRYDKELNQQAESNFRSRKEKMDEELREICKNLKLEDSDTARQMCKEMVNTSLSAEQKKEIDAEVELIKKSIEQREMELNLAFEKRKQENKLREKKLEEERLAAAAEAARAAQQATKAAEEEKERLIKQEKEAAEKKIQEEVAKKLAETAAQEAEEKVAAQRKKAEAEAKLKSDAVVQDTLSGFIFKDDQNKYVACTELIQKYEVVCSNLVTNSSDPTIKKFYGSARKSIIKNINAVANVDPQQLSLKINYFINLLDGLEVEDDSSTNASYKSSDLPNGKEFVCNLFAFRFVKRAELENLTQENRNGFEPMAKLAFAVGRKHPEWASLVKAYLYKMCPFLVPFSFPRDSMTIGEYSAALGHEIQGTDTLITQELLGRIKGFCSLYATMVRMFTQSENFDVGEATSFFSLGGAWEILAKTIKLKPQPDVTVTLIQTLLERLSDQLSQAYGVQFKKLVHTLITTFLPNLKQVTANSDKAGVNRFQTFLEQKYLC